MIRPYKGIVHVHVHDNGARGVIGGAAPPLSKRSAKRRAARQCPPEIGALQGTDTCLSHVRHRATRVGRPYKRLLNALSRP